ncbi:hypothetical protein Glove_199g39 [Diversispora epigaea]|uniref:BTB domain-containing protein n=1 Tax=Diversispora epigaea TaxID=1348612 RepID=A0A397IN52_9GLOM|nr:hypothetical protein Glove_199g39 [Diversispora epigaea]
MTLKFFDKLSQNFIELLNDKDDHNVIIKVENSKKSFTAHSSVLKYRSSYFRMELENIQPNGNNVKIITKSSISAQIFDIILKYIYGGIVNLENVETKFIFDLMLVANEFELEELTGKLETILIDTKASWLKTHFSLVYRTIFDRQNFKKLENYCNDIIVKYPNLVFDSSDFTSLQESALVSLLKRDDLQMKEVEIWDYVINTEIFDKIRPYKKIIDKQLWEDINQYFLASDRPVKSIILPARSLLVTELPPRTNEPKEHFSTIISEDHVAEISAWIDRKVTNYLTTNNPYKFELILRGTRDEFNPQKFWDICHGHASTVVVVKVNGTDEIIGGYNPLAWDNSNSDSNNRWAAANDSFIFSLKNGNIQNSILSRSNFTLGSNCFCHDQGSHYERSISSSTRFSIVDYEMREGKTREKELRIDKEEEYLLNKKVKGKGKEMENEMKNEAREEELREVDGLQKWNLN